LDTRKIATRNGEIAPGGFSQEETKVIIDFLDKIESTPAYRVAEVQEIADNLESSNIEYALKNTTKPQILLILDFFNRGLIHITVGLAQLIIEIARQKYSSNEEFMQISGKIHMAKIIASTRERDIKRCYEQQKNSCRTLFAINSSLFSGSTKQSSGWTNVGKFMIRNFYDHTSNMREIFIEIGASLLKQENSSKPKENDTINPLEEKNDESKLANNTNDDSLKQAAYFSSTPLEQAPCIQELQENQEITTNNEGCDEIKPQGELLEAESAHETKEAIQQDVFRFQEFHKISNLDKDEFLKKKDPTCEVKKFIKKVIKSINNYNLANKKSIRCFNDNKYYLLVIQRYPKETKENVITYQILIEKDEYGRLKITNN
jgi:hypothetical protein